MLNCPPSEALLVVKTTPGVNSIKLWKLRPFIGRLSANCRSTTVLTVAFSVFTSGAPPCTVTISWNAPTSRVKLMDKESCTLSVMSGLIRVLNPIFDTWTRYGPGGRFGRTYMPSLFVLVVCCTLVTSLTATISASATAALVGSEIRPLMFPLGDWPNEGMVITAIHTKTQTTRGKRMSALQRATECQPLIQ